MDVSSTRDKVEALEAELRAHESRQSFISRFDTIQKIFIGIWFAVVLLILVLLAYIQPFFVTVESEEDEDEQVLSLWHLFKWFIILSLLSGIALALFYYKKMTPQQV